MNLPLINSEAATPFLGKPPIDVACVFLNVPHVLILVARSGYTGELENWD